MHSEVIRLYIYFFLDYFLESIHVVVNGSILFFFRVECNYSTVYMYHPFLSQLSIDGHPGCFHILAGSAVMNIGVHVSF